MLFGAMTIQICQGDLTDVSCLWKTKSWYYDFVQGRWLKSRLVLRVCSDWAHEKVCFLHRSNWFKSFRLIPWRLSIFPMVFDTNIDYVWWHKRDHVEYQNFPPLQEASFLNIHHDNRATICCVCEVIQFLMVLHAAISSQSEYVCDLALCECVCCICAACTGYAGCCEVFHVSTKFGWRGQVWRLWAFLCIGEHCSYLRNSHRYHLDALARSRCRSLAASISAFIDVPLHRCSYKCSLRC